MSDLSTDAELLPSEPVSQEVISLILEGVTDMKKRSLSAKDRLLDMAQKAVTVTGPEAVKPTKSPSTRPLAVRLPTALVDAMHNHKITKGVEMSALVRPVLERVFLGTEAVPVDVKIEKATGAEETTTTDRVEEAKKESVELPDWMPIWGRMFYV